MLSALALLIAGVTAVMILSKSAHAKPSRFRGNNSTASQNSAPKQPRVIYKQRNTVDFDASLIEGDVKNPTDFYFVHRPQEKFGTLVKRRPNFHKEMLRDTVMIR